MVNGLRPNQINAIKTSCDNDFKSGIHYHATGTGKSWIAMSIVKEYHSKYPKGNILWLCERKDILNQQFTRETLKERGFKSILNGFNVMDYANKKCSNWYDSLNAPSFWGLPFLCIINRCFLTTKDKYENIKSGACQYNTKKVIVQGIGKIKRECEYFPGLECKGKEISFF